MLVLVIVVITVFCHMISARGPCLSSQPSEFLKPKVSLCLLPANSEKNLVVSFFFCLLLSCGNSPEPTTFTNTRRPRHKTGRCGAAGRGQALETRHAATGTKPSWLRPLSSATEGVQRCGPPPTPRSVGVSQRLSRESGEQGRGRPSPQASPGPARPGCDTPPPWELCRRDPLHEAHPLHLPAGWGGGASSPGGNAAEAWGPRRSWSPAPGAARR